MKRTALVFGLVALVAAVPFAAGSANHHPGALDRSFGQRGLVLTPGISPVRIALQRDGKIVTAGISQGGASVITLCRYRPGGALDVGFGRSGVVRKNFGTDSNAAAVKVQQNNKILVGGYVVSNGVYDFALVRFNPDGSLDGTFGSRGYVLTAVGARDAQIGALALLPSGKIIAGGTATGQDGTADFALARYTKNGRLDRSFGSGGIVLTNFHTPAEGFGQDSAQALAIQPDGKIVAAGVSGNRLQDHTGVALARYSPNGSLDPSFGQAGEATRWGADSIGAWALARRPNGALVVGVKTEGPYLEVDQFTKNGGLDRSFGRAGVARHAFAAGDVSLFRPALALQADGGVLETGAVADAGFERFSAALVRFKRKGSVDSRFGRDGLVTVGARRALFTGVVKLGPKRVLVSGVAAFDGVGDGLLARYWTR